jgi:nitroreductase
MRRRHVLYLLGGGVVLAAGSAGGFVLANGPSEAARAPWREAGQDSEFRRRALSFALLAPNPHNRQPWLVRLEGTDALSLYCDLERRLPVTDPFDRQITIGCGAFLELLSIAAAEDGYRAEITAFPDGEDSQTLDRRAVAHVRFIAGAGQPDSLFAQIVKRRSSKDVYEPRDVPDAMLAELATAGQFPGLVSRAVGNTDLAARLRDLTWRAHEREVLTPAAMKESVDLMRLGAEEVSRNPDGITLEGPMIAFGRLAGILTRDALGDPSSAAFAQSLDIYRALTASGRAYGWMTNANASRQDQISAGRAYVRMNLRASELGLGVHPLSQSLQEYAEMSDLFDELHALVGDGQRVQMLYRIGFAPPPGPTPRRGLKAHLV